MHLNHPKQKEKDGSRSGSLRTPVVTRTEEFLIIKHASGYLIEFNM